MTATPVVKSVAELCHILAPVPYPPFKELADAIQRATPGGSSQLIKRVLALMPGALSHVRESSEQYIEGLARDAERAEEALLALRNRQDLLGDFHLAFDCLVRDSEELIRNHLPDALNNAKALHFAETILIDSYDVTEAEMTSAEAQGRLFEWCVGAVSEMFDEFYEELMWLLAEAEVAIGGIVRRPVAPKFRPVKFSPIRLFTTSDLYEKARMLVTGGNLPEGLKPIKGLLFSLARRTRIPMWVITAGFGVQSLATSRRVQIRRELVTAGSEQMRRVSEAALNQLSAAHRALDREFRLQTLLFCREERDALNRRLSELAAQRRQTFSHVAKLERKLYTAERIAREILAESE